MFRGFALKDGGALEHLDDHESVPHAAAPASAVWLDLETPTEDELAAVAKAYNLDAEAVDDCIRGEQRPRIDDFDNYIFIVLYGMLRDDGEGFNPGKLAAFCGRDFLITVHREPLQTITEVRTRCERHGVAMLNRGVDNVLYHIIDGMADRYVLTSDAYEEQLEALEDKSLGDNVDGSILEEVSDMRRELLELRRIAASQNELLMPLTRGDYEYITETLEVRFSHVRDHFRQVVEQIDGLRERLNGVRDNYHTALSNRLNRIIKTLTIFASLMLPMSVIAGIYGMNLPVWPAGDSPQSFWIVIGAMAALGTVLYGFFRWRRWI